MATLNAEKWFPYNLHEDVRIRGFAEGLGKAFNAFSDTIDAMNIYDLDNIPEAVLDGYAKDKKIRGYEYCANIAEKRLLAKNGILLKRRSGTAWAVYKILEIFGFTAVIIDENVTPDAPIADGTFKANGWINANGSLIYQTYFFKVGATNMTGNEAKARQLIYHYKDAKSYLLEVYNY